MAEAVAAVVRRVVVRVVVARVAARVVVRRSAAFHRRYGQAAGERALPRRRGGGGSCLSAARRQAAGRRAVERWRRRGVRRRRRLRGGGGIAPRCRTPRGARQVVRGPPPILGCGDGLAVDGNLPRAVGGGRIDGRRPRRLAFARGGHGRATAAAPSAERRVRARILSGDGSPLRTIDPRTPHRSLSSLAPSVTRSLKTPAWRRAPVNALWSPSLALAHEA